MSEKESQFRSFEESKAALVFELQNEELNIDRAFEIAAQVIKLKPGDETAESQKAGILQDLIPQKQELIERYQAADELGKQELSKFIKKVLTNISN